MTESTSEAASGGSERQPTTEITVEGEGRLSVADAARALAGARYPRPKDPQQAAAGRRTEPAAQAACQESTADPRSKAGASVSDATSQETPETRGETENADPGVELPPIEPPRSWTKEDKELFTSLPRGTQERIAEREQSRE